MKKFKALLFIVLIAGFFTACSSVIPPPAEAEVTAFVWEPVTTDSMGNPVSLPVHYNIYCDAFPAVNAGLALEFNIKDALPASVPDGKHSCVLSAHYNQPCPDMTVGICEGEPSNTLTFTRRGPKYFAGTEPGKGRFRFK